MELLTKLGIDWKLLLAQAVNFGIILGVLTALVYRPLLNLMDQRRERIAKALEHARKLEEQNKEFEALREKELRKIDQEGGSLLERAKANAEKAKEEILASAKREADQILERGRLQLVRERDEAMREVQQSLARMILTLTQKILQREFSDADQKRLLSSLEQEIPTLVL